MQDRRTAVVRLARQAHTARVCITLGRAQPGQPASAVRDGQRLPLRRRQSLGQRDEHLAQLARGSIVAALGRRRKVEREQSV